MLEVGECVGISATVQLLISSGDISIRFILTIFSFSWPDLTSNSVQVQETTSITVVGVAPSPRPPDGLITVRCSDFSIYLTILRQNDHYPMFSQKVYSVTYNDSTPPGQVIPSICTDQDIGIKGALTTNISMDYRRARGCTVVQLCSDTGGTTPPLYTIGQIMATVEIIWSTTLAYSLQSNPYFIIDSLNVFTPGERSFDINELSPIGTSVATFKCTDVDNGTNGQISYSITGGNIDGAFQINQVTGVVQVANLLILPQNLASSLYQITIQCSDHAVPIKSNVTLAYFNVYQDNALRNFTSGFIAYVNENANINDTVIAINASFQYPSTYSFINESVPNVFTIDANTGVVRVAAHLDHDTVSFYTMTVVAIWSVDPARNSSALLTIYV
eukprot:Em0009g198a